MKRMKIWAIVMIAMVTTMGVKAQEITAKADVVSSYVWRGTKYAGVSVQPSVTYANGSFAIGAWGSTDLAGATLEMDLFATYAFDFGLTLGLTDYYYPGSSYFAGASHGLEANLAYAIGDLSLAANYIPFAGAGTIGNDLYFEAGYAFKSFSVFAGAGNGWHTADNSFKFCNVGIKTTKEIKITDTFSLPLTGSVILNPDRKEFYIVAGISL
jgi:hypothetical protein